MTMTNNLQLLYLYLSSITSSDPSTRSAISVFADHFLDEAVLICAVHRSKVPSHDHTVTLQEQVSVEVLLMTLWH